MEKTGDSERCQVRSGTNHPCEGTAVTEIWGVLFCESCAREQATYAAIGKIPWDPSSGEDSRAPVDEPLAHFKDEMGWDLSGRLAESGRLLRAAKQEILYGRVSP